MKKLNTIEAVKNYYENLFMNDYSTLSTEKGITTLYHYYKGNYEGIAIDLSMNEFVSICNDIKESYAKSIIEQYTHECNVETHYEYTEEEEEASNQYLFNLFTNGTKEEKENFLERNNIYEAVTEDEATELQLTIYQLFTC